MAEVKSAYNFVPVSDKVYFPQWAKDISMDVPFRDGLSGVIELTMTAQTPVFVCNGHKKAMDGNEEDKSRVKEEKSQFSNYDNQFFIPGTSIKGMVRNLLGIMSFGKMKTDPRARYAQREWGNSELYPIKGQLNAGFHCGWLKPKEKQIDSDYTTYEIIDCGKPYRISHKEIDRILDGRKLEQFFSEKSKVDITKPIDGLDPKTAYFKYKYIVEDRDALVGYSFTQPSSKTMKVVLDDEGHIEGTIVLTGQPDQWKFPRPKDNAGKFYEFVFKDYDEKSNRHVLTEEEFENFCFIYEDSDDWKLAKERLKEEGIPVFFRLKEKSKKIKDFGLAYLYKLPYEHSPQECLGVDHRKTVESPDLKECIFGYSENIDRNEKAKVNESLRGRVQFTHAFALGTPIIDKKQTLILASPKASYYPFYIYQKEGTRGKINTKFRTYNEADSRLSGWKRYPMREKTWEGRMDSEKLDTTLIPLSAGTTFKCFVNFHNLTYIELGALLSTLTFHNTPNCYHQLGQAKPYGFGRMKFDAKLKGDFPVTEEELMACYEIEMDKFLMTPWAQNNSIKDLFTLANVLIKNEDRFKYPELKVNGPNDFVTYKGGANGRGEKNYLERFSAIVGKSIAPISLSNDYKEKIEQLLCDKETEVKKAKDFRKAENQLKKEREILEIERLKHRLVEDELRSVEAQKQKEAEDAERVKKEADEEAKKRQADKIESGIGYEINKRDNNGNYRIQNFKNLKDRCDSFLKIQKRNIGQSLFNDSDRDAVHETLMRLNQKRDKKEAKQWTNFDDKFLWGSIRSWVGDELAKPWFDELNR